MGWGPCGDSAQPDSVPDPLGASIQPWLPSPGRTVQQRPQQLRFWAALTRWEQRKEQTAKEPHHEEHPPTAVTAAAGLGLRMGIYPGPQPGPALPARSRANAREGRGDAGLPPRLTQRSSEGVRCGPGQDPGLRARPGPCSSLAVTPVGPPAPPLQKAAPRTPRGRGATAPGQPPAPGRRGRRGRTGPSLGPRSRKAAANSRFLPGAAAGSPGPARPRGPAPPSPRSDTAPASPGAPRRGARHRRPRLPRARRAAEPGVGGDGGRALSRQALPVGPGRARSRVRSGRARGETGPAAPERGRAPGRAGHRARSRRERPVPRSRCGGSLG